MARCVHPLTPQVNQMSNRTEVAAGSDLHQPAAITDATGVKHPGLQGMEALPGLSKCDIASTQHFLEKHFGTPALTAEANPGQPFPGIHNASNNYRLRFTLPST